MIFLNGINGTVIELSEDNVYRKQLVYYNFISTTDLSVHFNLHVFLIRSNNFAMYKWNPNTKLQYETALWVRWCVHGKYRERESFIQNSNVHSKFERAIHSIMPTRNTHGVIIASIFVLRSRIASRVQTRWLLIGRLHITSVTTLPICYYKKWRKNTLIQ